ncbi:MAG TPA: hypothetical protein VFC44_15165, partial [Candidatus Saccharimonadales bacterium]|nr:hypothetical protein [Candidatus Saccharimonadales bacterium]
METKNREKLLLIATGACVVLWLLNLFVISPLTASWKNRSKQIDDLRKSIADGHVLVRRQDSILGRWSRMNTNALASTPTVAERQLFEAFNHWVGESGVTQGSFKPQLKETDDGYSTEDCRADVTGTIQSIVRFLYDVEKDPMAVRLQGLEITSRDDTGKQLSLGMDLSGLLQPPPDPLLLDIGAVASAEETNSNPALSWTNFQTLAEKNIFDPSRTGRIRFNNLARRPPPVLFFTFGGTIEDGPT